MILVDTLPKISCLMITANKRLELVKRSYQCYINQTYPNRELFVVNEGTKEYQLQLKELMSGREDVNFLFLNGKYSLGALRNMAIRLCCGEVFCQWDDDDFNSDERLAIQYRHLSKSNTVVCYLSDQLHYYFSSKQLFWESWGTFHSGGIKKFSLIPGTIMAYKKLFYNRYPSSGLYCSLGEDTILAYDWCNNED